MEQYRQTEEIKSAEVKAYYIPARAKEEIYHNTKIRVCAYCRVSTDSDAQLTSFALQREHYQNYEYASELGAETYLCGRGDIRNLFKETGRI